MSESQESLADEFGAERVVAVPCDVTVEEQVSALLDAADVLGGVDVMVNNAVLGATANVLDMTDEEWSRVLDITLNNASVVGWRAQEGQGHYAAAMAGSWL